MVPRLEAHPSLSGRHKIFLCILSLTSCGGCEETTPVTAIQEESPPILEIAPKGASVAAGESLRFTVLVTGGLEGQPSVSWLASGGVIDQGGLFRAGEQAGSYEVRAELLTRFGVVSDVSAGLIVPRDEGGDLGGDGGEDVLTGTRVLFQDDFEGNYFGQWSGLAPAGDPRWNGSGDGGAHHGDGYITDEQARSGRLAWKALVDPTQTSSGKANKSGLARWKGMGVREFYISAWYFIPPEYPAVSSQLMQIKAGGSGPSYRPVGYRIRKDRELIIRNGILGEIIYRTGVKVPLGKWFNLTGRFVIADSGLVEMWLDDQKIASVRTDTKDNDFAYPGVGNYVDGDSMADCYRCYLYIDDVKVTTPLP